MRNALFECATDSDVIHVEGAYAAGIIPVDLRIAKVLSLPWTLRCDAMLRCAQRPHERLYGFSHLAYGKIVYLLMLVPFMLGVLLLRRAGRLRSATDAA